MNDTQGNGTAPRRIVIVGGGLDAWLAAAALAEASGGHGWRITVVPVADEVERTALDTTLPLPPDTHTALRVIDDRRIATSGGAFTFGIALSGWSAPGATYFHPFGPPGAGLGSVNFVHIVMRLRHEGLAVRFGNYTMATLAAQAGRFTKPLRDAGSVLSTCDYGLHADTAGLQAALRVAASRAGVDTTAAFAAAEFSSPTTLAAVATADGARIEGDLFLDCTSRGLLFPADDWQDWSPWLPCDRYVCAVNASDAMPPPYSHAAAHRAGWTRHVAVPGSSMLCAYFDGAAMTEAEAAAVMRQAGDGDPGADILSGTAASGRRGSAWLGNRVAIGRAAARIDPVAVSDLNVAIAGIDRLLKLLPAGAQAVAESQEYNRQMQAWLDNARDFAMLHYKLNGRRGEPFWDARRAMPVPDTLDYKMQLYQSRGRVALYDEEPLEEHSWINLFDEHGVKPRQYNRIADGFARADLEAHLGRIRAVMIDELGRMPAHGDYVAGLRDAAAVADASAR